MAANFSPEDFLRSNDKKVRRSNTLFDRELQNCEKCLWKSKKYRKQRTELSLQKVRNLQVIGKIANTGVYNCGRLIFKKQEIAICNPSRQTVYYVDDILYNSLSGKSKMKTYMKIFSAALLAVFLCGCFGPVLQMGDRVVPAQNYKGVPVVSARNPIYKEIHYSTFGFDWDENDGFLIPVRQNSVNSAFWASKLTQAEKLYSVVCTAAKLRHYIQKPDTKNLQQYLEYSYRQVPGSKIQRSALKIEQCYFKGLPAVYVYLETFEKGRDLYLREESYFFFDPLEPDTLVYQVRWSERGKKSDWKSPDAETQGRRFFECFKLLPAKNNSSQL